MNWKLTVICLLFGSLVTGQRDLFRTGLISAGDTVRMLVDNFPNTIHIVGTGTSQSWDMTGLQSPYVYRRNCQPVQRADESIFPGAKFYISEGTSRRDFMFIENGILKTAGYSGYDPLGLNIYGHFKFEKPYPIYYSSMRYGSERVHENQLVIPVPLDKLPEHWLRKFPYSPDSVRIRVQFVRKDHYDGLGRLNMPNGTFSALREKRVEIRTKIVELKRVNIPWQNISELLEDETFVMKDSSVTIHFYNQNITGPMAQVIVDPVSSEPVKAFYWTERRDRMPVVMSIDRPGVYAYPNPNFGFFRVDILNLPKGFYSLRIFDLLGKDILLERHYVPGTKTLEISLTTLPKGTYFYSILDEQGKPVITKRLVVFRP